MRTPPQTSEDSGGVVKRHLRRNILLFCVLLFIAVLGLVLLIVFTTITCNLETCSTTTCLQLLARFLKAHNNTIDPCEDFFNYTCGNWDANYTRGMNMPLVNVFDVLLEENQLIMKRLLEEPQLGVNSSAKEKAVRFYTSCMNTEQIEARGAQPLKELINEIGGWNITGSWNETDFNQTLQILMGKYNTFPFFKAYVGPSSLDPSTNIIQIDHPEFELPSETDFKKTVKYPQVLRSYYLYLMKLGLLMGGNIDITSTYISLAFFFTSNLQKAVTPLEKRQEKRMLFYFTTINELQHFSDVVFTTSDKVLRLSNSGQGEAESHGWLSYGASLWSVAQLVKSRGASNKEEEKAPAIDWLSCLQAAFHPVKLNMSQPVAVHDMDYLQGMSQLIAEWQKRRDVLQIYMILCLVGNLSPALNKQFQEAHQNLTDMLYRGTTESQMVRSERWRKCLSETSTFFGPVLGKMVVQEIFPQKAKDLAELIFAEIRDAVHSHLDHVEWMGYQSRQEAKEKIHSLRVEIGYPEKILQGNEADDEYQELEIYEDDFFHNVVACLESLRKRFSLKLGNSHLQDNWEVAPWSVHSYYSLRRHAVVFPAGMFRSPFFHTEFPSAVNFGAMGFFMAHELLHSFYDYVLTKNCSSCDMRTLVQGIDCLVKQYESYSLDGHPINGTFTLLENAADTEGLAIAYQAYQNWLAKQRRVKKLPWPGLSHNQLFFISFAHAMCGHPRLKGLQTFLHRDPHSPPSFRVLGSLSNSQDFSRVFHCPSKAQMNPALKCHIW